jgi:hypothetical protein
VFIFHLLDDVPTKDTALVSHTCQCLPGIFYSVSESDARSLQVRHRSTQVQRFTSMVIFDRKKLNLKKEKGSTYLFFMRIIRRTTSF